MDSATSIPTQSLEEVMKEMERCKAEGKTELSLASCDLNGESLRNALASVASHGHILTHIDLSGNKIGPDDVGILWNSLKTCRWLIGMNLSDNLLGNFGAKQLAVLLRDGENVRRKLASRSLSSEQLGDKTLFAPLELDLSGNKIGDDGIIQLSDALQENRSIRSLNLARNTFSDVGLKVFAESLRGNNVLTSLNVNHNSKVSTNGVKELVKVLVGNYSLHLDVTNLDQADVESRKRLEDAVQRNITLRDQLHKSVKNADKDGIAKFLRFQVSLASKTEGSTCLHWAIQHQNLEIIQLLLEKHANPKELDANAMNALALAKTTHCPLDILNALQTAVFGIEEQEKKKGNESEEEEFEDDIEFGDISDDLSLDSNDLDELDELDEM